MNGDMMIIGISIALAMFGIYREYQRSSKRYLAWRILAFVIAVIALACLALPLTYKSNGTESGHRDLLLTEGFAQDSLRLNASDSIYTFSEAIHRQYPKAVLLNDISQLNSTAPLHIFGYGLSKTELEQLDKKAISFHPSPIPQGILSANWTDRLQTSEPFIAQLKYNNRLSKTIKIVLKGLNTTLDSVAVLASTTTDISLKTTPRQSGKTIFNVLVINGKDTLEQQQIPLIISPIKPINILMLSAAPDFELKFLKNWLGQHGYGLASRSAITKGKFSQEFVNIEQKDLSRLSSSLFQKFDVVISDGSTLQSLNPAENSTLQQAVTQNGLGVIVRADTVTAQSSWLLRDIKLNNLGGKQGTSAILHLQDGIKTEKLAIQPTYIIPKNNTQTLVSDEQQHVLANANLIGAGHLILSIINNTYNWQLSGNKADYDALWSLLISKAARKQTATTHWQVKGAMPSIGSPVNMELEGDAIGSSIAVNGEAISPTQDGRMLFKHSAQYYPNTAGWQQVGINNSEPFWWYLWDKNDWKSLNATAKLSATTKYVKNQQTNTLSAQKIIVKRRVAVPKFYFFILFLMAATFLWAETKFFNT